MQQSIDYFQQAIQKDPRYALAYAGQADAYALLADFNVLPAREVMPKLKSAARKALRLDDSLAEAHTSLAWAQISRLGLGRRGEGIQARDRTEPGLSDGACLVRRVSDGAGPLRRGAARDESRLRTKSGLAGDQPGAGLPLLLRASVSAGNRAVPEDAGPGAGFYLRARLPGPRLPAEGKYPEASRSSARRCSFPKATPTSLRRSGTRYAAARQQAEARKILAELKERSQQTYVQPMWIAVIHLALGEKDQAFDWMQRPMKIARHGWSYLKVDPAVRQRADGPPLCRPVAPSRA